MNLRDVRTTHSAYQFSLTLHNLQWVSWPVCRLCQAAIKPREIFRCRNLSFTSVPGAWLRLRLSGHGKLSHSRQHLAFLFRTVQIDIQGPSSSNHQGTSRDRLVISSARNTFWIWWWREFWWRFLSFMSMCYVVEFSFEAWTLTSGYV